jgi:hypothetical protein
MSSGLQAMVDMYDEHLLSRHNDDNHDAVYCGVMWEGRWPEGLEVYTVASEGNSFSDQPPGMRVYPQALSPHYRCECNLIIIGI